MIQKYEYKIEYMGHEKGVKKDALNKLGAEGWELVCVADDNKFGGRYIFKRPINTI